MNDVLPSSLPAALEAGGAPGNEAVLYVTQKYVDPSTGVTGLNTDPATVTTLTTTAAVTASPTPTSVTFTAPIGVALQKGEILQFGSVALEVNADTPATATSVQFSKIPVNLPSGSSITYAGWAKVILRGGSLPSFLKQANFSTIDLDSGQIRLPSTPTVRDETIQSGGSVDDPAQWALLRAGLAPVSQSAKKTLGYCFFSPGVGSGPRIRLYGYMTVGSSSVDTAINTVSTWTHNVSALGDPVAFDKQPRAS